MFKILRWLKVYRWYRQLKADLKAGQDIAWTARIAQLIIIINGILDAEGLPKAPYQPTKPESSKPESSKPGSTDYDFS